MEAHSTAPDHSVHVTSERTLEELASGIGNFRDRAREAVDLFLRGLRHAQSILNDQHREAERAEYNAKLDLDQSDKDDREHYRTLFRSARQEAQKAKDRCQKLRQAVEMFQGRVLDFRKAIDHAAPTSLAFMREKLQFVRELRSIELQSVQPETASSGSPSLAGSPANESLMSFPLPADFTWIPLGDIELEKELEGVQVAKAFQKVPYDQMRQGLERFRQQILPSLRADPSSHNSSFFGNQDQISNTPHEQGLQCVYDAFFGGEAIHLDRGRHPEKYSIIDGRHRIKVAFDLGWPARSRAAKQFDEYRNTMNEINTAIEDLRSAWSLFLRQHDAAASNWKDEAALRFDQQFWSVYEAEVPRMLGAMQELGKTIQILLNS